MNVEILNPSAWNALRVSIQDRSRNVFEKAPAAAPAPKRDTHAVLHARAVAIVERPTRVTVNEGGVLRSVERLVPMPAYQAAGYESASQYVTEISERQLRESQAAAPAAPAVQRVRDEWSAETKPFASIPPGTKLNLPLGDDSKRYIIECVGEDVTLQIQNQSTTRTLRLRNREKAGDVHVAFVAPAQVAIVTAGSEKKAVIELLPQ
jgi:hypothetical protein